MFDRKNILLVVIRTGVVGRLGMVTAHKGRADAARWLGCVGGRVRRGDAARSTSVRQRGRAVRRWR